MSDPEIRNPKSEMFAPGRHVLADFFGCPPEILNDAKRLEKMLLEAAEKMRATVVSSNFNQFNPIGVSGVVVIAESHLTVHTWPELGYAAVDFFTCGELDSRSALLFLEKELGAQRRKVRRLRRGQEAL